MNRGSDRIVCLFAMYCLSAVIAVTSLLQIARGQEELPPPLPKLPGAHPRQVLISDHTPRHGQRVVIITNAPAVGQLFRNACPGPTGCEEMLQRMSAAHDCESADECRVGEFHFHVFGELPPAEQPLLLSRVWLRPGDTIDTREVRHGERRFKASQFERFDVVDAAPCAGETAGRFLHAGCQCVAAGECTCGPDSKCGGVCAGHCPDCQCDGCSCAAHAAHNEEVGCGDDCAVRTMIIRHAENQAEHDEELADFHPLKLMQHIAGLMAEKAAAQAALEVREEASEQLGEVYEAMAEVMADNAALDAKLAALGENKKLLERISDLAAENARLKAHAELAAERIELAKSTFALSLENERLKMRLADLEQKHSSAEAARTASNPRSETK